MAAHRRMRSKVRIDEDLMAELRARARAERLSMTRLLNRMLRAGLAVSSQPGGEHERYEEMTVQMGRPRVEIDKALSLAAEFDDEEVRRKMSLRQ